MTARTRRFLPWALVALCAARSAALGSGPAAPSVSAPAATPGPVATPAPAAQPKRNIGGPADYNLRERILAALRGDPDLRQQPIRLILVNGGAVFSGEVSSCALKMRALRFAAATRDVINVTDDMRVPGANLPDEALRKAVADVLEGSREALGLKNFEVTVEDGVATLEGTVDTFAARVRAEDVAGAVQGITRISNHLRPADAPAGTDEASLVKAVVDYLSDFRNYGHPAEIEVAAAAGVVTLTGRVGLYLARQQAAVLASLVKGAARVENRITVDPAFGPFVGERPRPTIVKARP